MENRNLNNKGFTMVELLAAIVIMGLLSAFAIVSVSAILDKAEKNHYETQQKNMIMAAQSYAQDNRNVLPKEIGSSRVITLKELQNRKYIGEVLDRSKNACSNGTLDQNGSYVEIFRYSKDGYSYRPYLKCPKYETGKDVYGGTGPNIELTLNSNYNNPSFSYEITTSDDGKIISYSYVIYKHGVLVRDSGSVPVSRVGSVDKKEVSLKDLVPGEFEIIFTATNMYGKTNTKKISGTIQDKDGPDCGVTTGESTTWQAAASVEVTVGCNDNSGSGCSREIFSQLITDESQTNFIVISDNLGNKTSCEVNSYIDRTKPTAPIITNPYENTWINQNYSINIKSTDDTSGVAYYEYRYPNSIDSAEKNWTKFADSVRGGDSNPGTYSFDTPEFTQERGEYIEVRACDYAGNCSDSTKSMIKIDKTAPTCAISRNIASPNGSNDWYKTQVTLSMANTDPVGTAVTAVASPLSYSLTTSSTATYTGMNLTATQGDTTGVTWKGYVRDEAGNATSCGDASFKVDTTPPTTPTITNPNASGSTVNWVNSNFSLTVKSKDVTSGIASFQYTYLSTASSVTENDTTGWVTYANSSAAANTEKTFTTTAFSAERNQPVYIRVCDNAGNCTGSSNTTIKIDKTAPTCVSSGGSTSWVKSLTLTGTCSDTFGECASNVTKAYTTTTNATNQSPGAVKDKAGNSIDCPANQTVKVDATAPSTPSISNPTGGSKTCDAFALTVSTTEQHSGVAYWQYKYDSSSSWTTYGSSASTNYTTTNFSASRNEYVHLRACDNVGNCGSSAKTKIYIGSWVSGYYSCSSGGSRVGSRCYITYGTANACSAGCPGTCTYSEDPSVRNHCTYNATWHAGYCSG